MRSLTGTEPQQPGISSCIAASSEPVKEQPLPGARTTSACQQRFTLDSFSLDKSLTRPDLARRNVWTGGVLGAAAIAAGMRRAVGGRGCTLRQRPDAGGRGCTLGYELNTGGGINSGNGRSAGRARCQSLAAASWGRDHDESIAKSQRMSRATWKIFTLQGEPERSQACHQYSLRLNRL